MPIVGSESFFDDFGFNNEQYIRKFKWKLESDLDERESIYPPKRPLLPYLDSIAAGNFPKRWDHRAKGVILNDDWLLMQQVFKAQAPRR